jgi:ring-1,2-phenylacetyl-CoA epoxidase subunit PaaE
MTPKFHTLKVAEVRKETEDCVSILFEIPNDLTEAYNFIAGQYLTIKKEINGEEIRRSYSLCSSPQSSEIRVAVKKVENGLFSTFANESLKPGMELEVMTPTGNFAFNPKSSSNNNYVLFAAGSGITPVISIVKSILNSEPNSDITLFYGNKGFNSIIFREELEALKNNNMSNFRIVHVLSRESLGNDIQKGRIDEEKATELFNVFIGKQTIDGVYICGPEAMIHGVKDSMTNVGIDDSKVHFELFTTPTTGEVKKYVSDTPKVESNVAIELDGEMIEINLSSEGDKILDAAQKAGADLPFACKGGVCCTCKAKIIEGSAEMEVNYALEQEEVNAGYILTCQAHPTSEKLIISFDE